MKLRDFTIKNIEDILSDFCEQKMTNKLRAEIAHEMVMIASNAFRLGYYAKKKEGRTELDETEFCLLSWNCLNEELTDILWRIEQAGGTN